VAGLGWYPCGWLQPTRKSENLPFLGVVSRPVTFHQGNEVPKHCTAVFVNTYLFTGLIAYLLVCLFACLFTYLLTCLLAYLLTSLLTYLLTGLLAYILTCLLAYLLPYLLN